MVVNPTVSSDNGRPVGFRGAELTHPYLELTEAGFRVAIASPVGDKVETDALSDPRDPSRWSAGDLITTCRDNKTLHNAIRACRAAERVMAVYCARRCRPRTLRPVRRHRAGRREFAGAQIMPRRPEGARRKRGANHISAGLFKAFAVRDGRLITGRQCSSRKVARAVLAAIGA